MQQEAASVGGLSYFVGLLCSVPAVVADFQRECVTSSGSQQRSSLLGPFSWRGRWKFMRSPAIKNRSILLFAALHMSAHGRYCCKSLFALVIKNSPGCRRDFRVKMWGTSSPDDKLTGDLGNVIEARSGGRRLVRVMVGKLSPGNFRLLQQYPHIATLCGNAALRSLSERSGH